ncbi:MAG: YdbH domain-containing protein [Chlorobiaceae bacterium]
MPKLLPRLLIAVLLLLALLPAAAWLLFPWYAQSLLDLAIKDKPFRIEVSGINLPTTSGIRFRSLKAIITTPPDGCSNEAATYALSLTNGNISWRLKTPNQWKTGGFQPKLVDATFSLKADSLTITPKPQQFIFSDKNSLVTIGVEIFRDKNSFISIKPLSASYTINGATVKHEKLGLEGISYNIRLSDAEHWQQPLDTLRVEMFSSNGNPLPVHHFKALFGSKRDPLKPCTLTLSDCSVKLFQWKASTEQIEYDLKNKQSRLTINFAEIPLNELPGFNLGSNKTPFATGQISGSFPIEFRDSTLLVRNAVIVAGKGAKIISFTKEHKPLLSLDIGIIKGKDELLKNLNATITLNSKNNKLFGLTLSDLSATLLGGRISSTPVSVDQSTKISPFTLVLSHIKILDRIRLQGDFKGSLQGEVSGVVPLSMTNKSFSIQNARLQSSGGGRVTIAPPSKQQHTSERIFGPEKPDADYTFSEPDLLLNRTIDGYTTINFKLKHLQRKTSGGEMALLSPEGKLSLWQNRLKPDMFSLSNFTTGFLDGTVAIKNINYDMSRKEGETTLLLNNIPLQKMLDLQGTKKIYATGTVKGKIPVKIKNETFEILDGGMNAEQSGQIIYATTPEERAAANQGLRTTYEALSNFLYVQLASSISMAPNGQSVITVNLKGSNPDFQAGRPVELNLNVQQNLLDLMRTLSISSNVEQIISEKSLQLHKK